MKNIIKKALMAIICIAAFVTPAMADNDKPISVSELPTAAQQVLNSYFTTKKVALAKMESGIIGKSYDVIFTNGEKIEFDRKGQWTEIDCKQSSVPSKLVPSQITSYVNQNYSGNKILKIEKDDNEYEVNLSNGIEITFNKKFAVIDID